ncbi:unnamed protein product [Rotaria sp. Silwood2]|nr:unnamed protein product [Rotaria sp. Silwood2]CAF4148036.1 unnamed protein product [Rotaria sp. Silwood2]
MIPPPEHQERLHYFPRADSIPLSTTASTTGTSSMSTHLNDAIEFIEKLYEKIDNTIPITYIYLALLFMGLLYFILEFCCWKKENGKEFSIFEINPLHQTEPNENSNSNRQLFSTKVYPKKTIVVQV